MATRMRTVARTWRATGKLAGRVRHLEIAWNGGMAVVRMSRVVLAVAVALVAFPLAGIAVAMIELATVVWPMGEGDDKHDTGV